MIKSCPIIPLVGTVTAVGPDEGNVPYRFIEISEKGGRVRRPTVKAVRAYVHQHGRLA
jgi:hypothetical protein